MQVKPARVRRHLHSAAGGGGGALAAIWQSQKHSLLARPDEMAAVPISIERDADELDLAALEREFSRTARRGKMTLQDFQVRLAGGCCWWLLVAGWWLLLVAVGCCCCCSLPLVAACCRFLLSADLKTV